MITATVIDLARPESGDRSLRVFLPGAFMSASDYTTHGFLDAVRRRAWPIDIVAVDTDIEHYFDDDLTDHLHSQVISPALARGVTTIWLAGISLGGFGALRYAEAHREIVEGLLLLSPFLGSRGLIAEVAAAGGLGRWVPGTADQAPQHRLLSWLSAYRPLDRRWPEIRLAYGEDDRFSAAHRLLAEILPRDVVTTTAGGHDWETWEALWEQILQTAPSVTSKRMKVRR